VNEDQRMMLGFGTIILIVVVGTVWYLMEEATWNDAEEKYLYSTWKIVIDKEYRHDVWYTLEYDSNTKSYKSVRHEDEDWYIYYDDGSYDGTSRSTYRITRIGDRLEFKYIQQTRLKDGKQRTVCERVWHRK
jgi:hypothetical protein